jgi:hypothetical protein
MLDFCISLTAETFRWEHHRRGADGAFAGDESANRRNLKVVSICVSLGWPR